MSRPEFLNCVMTPEVIRGIRERQEAYDRNPAEYERREAQRKDDREREEQEERDECQKRMEEG